MPKGGESFRLGQTNLYGFLPTCDILCFYYTFTVSIGIVREYVINSVFFNQMSQIKFRCLRKSDEAIAELLFLEASGVPADWNSTAMVTAFKKEGKIVKLVTNRQLSFKGMHDSREHWMSCTLTLVQVFETHMTIVNERQENITFLKLSM